MIYIDPCTQCDQHDICDDRNKLFCCMRCKALHMDICEDCMLGED